MLKKIITMIALTSLYTAPTMADTLDDVIDRGELRCGVVLDFPPIGYRDANNEPAIVLIPVDKLLCSKCCKA